MMNHDRARALVGEIRLSVEGIRERLIELYDGRAWLALGYGSWADMCAAEFDSVAVGRLLPRDQRRELVTHLAGAGMSSRAIGSALGMSDMTVGRDRRATNVAPERRPRMTKRDGGTTWSRRVQTVSARCPMPELSDEEVAELLGAATFLADYCRGELATRGGRNGNRTPN